MFICHDCQHVSRFAKILVDRKTIGVVEHVCVLEIHALERDHVCHQVGFCLEAPRCGLHSALGACRVERQVFPVFVDFRFGGFVIRCVLLSAFSSVLELLPMPP